MDMSLQAESLRFNDVMRGMVKATEAGERYKTDGTGAWHDQRRRTCNKHERGELQHGYAGI